MARLPEEALTSPRVQWAWALFIYVVVVTIALLVWNAYGGGMVEGWYAEYVGPDGEVSGSGKWRTAEGRDFRNAALLFGTWVYPASVVVAGLLAREAFRVRGAAQRLGYLAAAAGAVYCLYRLCALGLLRAVSSF